ncbi:DinB family protein [Planctomycetes bacterium K23_9]|uniref:DinB family protein n=1 Tax=Stieleria marina TaxID=1930275 RepID=A0A517P0P8_9BACT|nr:DinB family protein [Planctomycetes bacterium K23_9]
MSILIDDLYTYNDWANDKVLTLCDGLTDQQLDTPREMGFGTLRATLFHILTAEQVWMERWQEVPWRPFSTDPAGMSVGTLRRALAVVAEQRRELIDENRGDSFARRISYQDSKKTPYDHVLSDLLLHVASHGVHHRAQALNYLRQFDRTLVGGVDYIFYRLATASVKQSCDSVMALKGYGLDVSDATDQPCPYDDAAVKRLFQYHDWATRQVLDFAADLPAESLDRDFQMGPGTIRKTLLHLYDGERWWPEIWKGSSVAYPTSRDDVTIATLRKDWDSLSTQRREYLDQLTAQETQRVVSAQFGGPPINFRIGVSINQLAMHGTHHRAQLINMFRHVGADWKNIDLLYAIEHL